MLKLSTISDPAGSYFLADPAHEVSDLFDRRRPGTWSGAAAERFGLGGSVEEQDLAAVLAGRPLGATLSPHPLRRRVGYDLTFAAPKPISVLFAFESDAAARRIVTAHEHGIDVALSYLEERGAVVGRSFGAERVGLKAEGLTCATFTHGVSRSHDPHLHSHVVIANLAVTSTVASGRSTHVCCAPTHQPPRPSIERSCASSSLEISVWHGSVAPMATSASKAWATRSAGP